MSFARARLLASAACAALASAVLLLGPLGSPARAECEAAVDETVHTTPVGETVCPRPTKPPTDQSTPKPKPSTVTQPTGTSTGSPATPTQVLGIRFTQPPPLTPFQQQQQPPPLLDGFPHPSFQSTGPGLPARPGGGGGYVLRVALLLALAGGGAFWLQRARVRGWMIGLGTK